MAGHCDPSESIPFRRVHFLVMENERSTFLEKWPDIEGALKPAIIVEYLAMDVVVGLAIVGAVFCTAEILLRRFGTRRRA